MDARREIRMRNQQFIYLFICSSFTFRYISYKILPFHMHFIRVNTWIWPFPLCCFSLKRHVLEAVSASHRIQYKRLWNSLCWVHWLELISSLPSIQQSFVYFTSWHKQSHRPKRRRLQQKLGSEQIKLSLQKHTIITNMWTLICWNTCYKAVSPIPPLPPPFFCCCCRWYVLMIN